MINIGVSLRVVKEEGYSESRDALAQDWYPFLKREFGNRWTLLPNLGADIVGYAEEKNLNGFVFTGGNDLGENPLRDESEMALLDHALRNRLPVLGVCRGFHLLNHYFGGKISRLNDRSHVAAQHSVEIVNDWGPTKKGERFEVNSFHNFVIFEKDLAASLTPFAISKTDGVLEGFFHSKEKVLALQWHPERENGASELDHRLISEFFK
jgi:putative glutamine amidotransferase